MDAVLLQVCATLYFIETHATLTNMYYALYAYPWDLMDDSPARWCHQFHDWQLNTLTMACSYHAGKFIRPHGKNSKVIFPEDGTVYFQASLSRYGLLKPKINPLIQAHDVLRAYTEQNDISVQAWLVLLHNSRLGLLHPDTTVCNAWGDRYVYSLCPCHPAVHEYAIQLCVDIAEHYPVIGLTLETPGFLPFEHGYHHEFSQIALNSWLKALLALCFCSYCLAGLQQQGIPARWLQQAIRKRVDQHWCEEGILNHEKKPDAFMMDSQLQTALGAMRQWRCQQVSTLLNEIRAHVRRECAISVIPTVQPPHSNADLEGSDIRVLATMVDFIECPFYHSSVEHVVNDAKDVIQRVGYPRKVRAILRPGLPDMTSAQQVVDTVLALRRLGIRDFSFYNLGLLPYHHLTWIADALTQLRQEMS